MKRTSNKSLFMYCEKGSKVADLLTFYTENPMYKEHKIKILQVQAFTTDIVTFLIEYEVIDETTPEN